MKTVHNRILKTCLVVLALYALGCAGLAWSFADSSEQFPLYFVRLLLGNWFTLLFLLVPSVLVFAGGRSQGSSLSASGVSSGGTGIMSNGTGVNGMPLDACGFDPMGNYQGIEASSTGTSLSDD